MRKVRRLRILGLSLAIGGLVATRLGVGPLVAATTAFLVALDLSAGMTCDAVVVLRLALIVLLFIISHRVEEGQLFGSQSEDLRLNVFVSNCGRVLGLIEQLLMLGLVGFLDQCQFFGDAFHLVAAEEFHLLERTGTVFVEDLFVDMPQPETGLVCPRFALLHLVDHAENFQRQSSLLPLVTGDTMDEVVLVDQLVKAFDPWSERRVT